MSISTHIHKMNTWLHPERKSNAHMSSIKKDTQKLFYRNTFAVILKDIHKGGQKTDLMEYDHKIIIDDSHLKVNIITF